MRYAILFLRVEAGHTLAINQVNIVKLQVVECQWLIYFECNLALVIIISFWFLGFFLAVQVHYLRVVIVSLVWSQYLDLGNLFGILHDKFSGCRNPIGLNSVQGYLMLDTIE